MAEIKLSQKQSLNKFRSYTTENTKFSADTDFTLLFDVWDFRTLAMQAKGIVAPDEIQVTWYLAHETTSTKTLFWDWILVKNENNLNPFTVDWLFQINIQNFAAVRIERVGSASSDIDVQVSLGANN